jgi:hypothetical protein
LPPAFTLVSCLAYSSTLKMEATCSSKMSVHFQWTTRQHIPEDSTLHENLFSSSQIDRQSDFNKCHAWMPMHLKWMHLYFYNIYVNE